MERIGNKILSNPELAKMLLQPDNGEKVFIGGQCKIIICPQPANLKFVLCDVKIEEQKSNEEKLTEKESAEINETQEKLIEGMEPTEASKTQAKLIVNTEPAEVDKTSAELIVNPEPAEASETSAKLIVNAE